MIKLERQQWLLWGAFSYYSAVWANHCRKYRGTSKKEALENSGDSPMAGTSGINPIRGAAKKRGGDFSRKRASPHSIPNLTTSIGEEGVVSRMSVLSGRLERTRERVRWRELEKGEWALRGVVRCERIVDGELKEEEGAIGLWNVYRLEKKQTNESEREWTGEINGNSCQGGRRMLIRLEKLIFSTRYRRFIEDYWKRAN